VGQEPVFAPGQRLSIRGAEWIVRRADKASHGEWSLQCLGVSELVRGKEARFLSELEGRGLRVLDPAETRLVHDTSARYQDTRLFLESLLRQSPPTDADLYLGHRAAIDLLPYQLDPALKALDQPRQRILMADYVGLGKTIEVGILLSELIRRGRGKRILVVANKGMMLQLQKELWSRFTIPLQRLDSMGLQRIRERIPSSANPFHYCDRAIISIDTLKNDGQYRVYLENCFWDVIVIDEAQNVAQRGSGLTLRAKLAKLLAARSDTLILTSATPHDGSAESFASLMNMLNPTAIADKRNYGPEDIKGLFLRRFKKDIKTQIASSAKERRVIPLVSDASPEEEAAYDSLTGLRFRSIDTKRKSGDHLFRTIMVKSLFSSPQACAKTIRERIRKLEKVGTPEAEHDLEVLQGLLVKVEAIHPQAFTRYQSLLAALRSGGELAWTGRDPQDRLVVFTERIETLNFLKVNLQRDLGLKDVQIETLCGTLPDTEQQKIVEAFGQEDAPVRLLIATDVASEGLNLHFQCCKLVHFDIPWSLMVFQQRNGRIDRYGQERQPVLAYLFTQSLNETINGDRRILEVLVEKDKRANENIGDPSSFMGVYSEEEEELKTGRAMEEGKTADAFSMELEENATKVDFLQLLLADEPIPTGQGTLQRTRDLPSLFPSDLEYVGAGLERLRAGSDFQYAFDRDRRLISLTENDEVRKALGGIPKEAHPSDRNLHLTTDRDLVKREIRECRAREERWPHIHLLWDGHPVMEWLNYKLQVAFGRHEAPVVHLGTALGEKETLVFVQGEIPNRKGQAAVHEWFAVRFEGHRYEETLPLMAFLDRTRFGRELFANPAQEEDLAPLQQLLPEVVRKAHEHMSHLRRAFEDAVNPKLDEHLKKLERLKGRQYEQLSLAFPEDETLKGAKKEKRDECRRGIDRNFDEFIQWVEDTMTTDDNPYLRVAAVFVR
jgi:ERCC4-related helicase